RPSPASAAARRPAAPAPPSPRTSAAPPRGAGRPARARPVPRRRPTPPGRSRAPPGRRRRPTPGRVRKLSWWFLVLLEDLAGPVGVVGVDQDGDLLDAGPAALVAPLGEGANPFRLQQVADHLPLGGVGHGVNRHQFARIHKAPPEELTCGRERLREV